MAETYDLRVLEDEHQPDPSLLPAGWQSIADVQPLKMETKKKTKKSKKKKKKKAITHEDEMEADSVLSTLLDDDGNEHKVIDLTVEETSAIKKNVSVRQQKQGYGHPWNNQPSTNPFDSDDDEDVYIESATAPQKIAKTVAPKMATPKKSMATVPAASTNPFQDDYIRNKVQPVTTTQTVQRVPSVDAMCTPFDADTNETAQALTDMVKKGTSDIIDGIAAMESPAMENPLPALTGAIDSAVEAGSRLVSGMIHNKAGSVTKKKKNKATEEEEAVEIHLSDTASERPIVNVVKQRKSKSSVESDDDDTSDDASDDDDDDEEDVVASSRRLLQMADKRLQYQQHTEEVKKLRGQISTMKEQAAALTEQLRRAVETKCDLVVAQTEMERIHEIQLLAAKDEIHMLQREGKNNADVTARLELKFMNDMNVLSQRIHDMDRRHRNVVLEKDCRIAQLEQEVSKRKTESVRREPRFKSRFLVPASSNETLYPQRREETKLTEDDGEATNASNEIFGNVL